jgi:peptidyl-prolyl cis-trans isomerase D
MFDFVDRHKRLIQVVLAVMFLPFAFFGVDVYFRDSAGGQAVAKVGGQAISQEEFSRALRERQMSIQNAVGGRIDPAMLDNPELRQAVLDGLIQRHLLVDQAQSVGISVSEDQLKRTIADVAVFRDETGKFSFSRYQEMLRSEGMTPAMFEARLRQDIMVQQLSSGLVGSTMPSRTSADLLLRLSGQQREISYATIAPEGFLGQVKLDPAAVRQYYDANSGEFHVPEQVRVDYVVLSAEMLGQGMAVAPDEVRKFYDTNRNQFGVEESRQAAHILVGVEAGASAEAKQKARAKADALSRDLQKNPGGFAEAAKKSSDDPGSAARGGDLGFISRGAMKDTPDLERAVFTLKPGEISAPVETTYGFHIVKVLAVQPGKIKPFEEVRAQIEKDLRKQLASRRFAELSDQFSNVVYEQSESLKAAAELAKAAPRQSGWITRTNAEAPLNHPRLIGAIFSDEVLKDRRNTEAIEVAPGTVVAARVVEHKAAAIQSFDEVRASIEKKVALREASRLAALEGRRLLGELGQGKSPAVTWSPAQLVSRNDPKGLPEPVLRQAFRLDTASIPAYAGTESPMGAFILLRVGKVVEAEGGTPEKSKALAEQMRSVLAQEVMLSYIASIKQKGGVKINKEYLEKKDDSGPSSAPAQPNRPMPPKRGAF